MGRRAKLDEETKRKLVEAALLGATRAIQAEYAGVGKSTLHRWLARGRKAKSGRFRDLWDSLKEAEGLGAARALAAIQGATSRDWKAAAWLLERRHGYRKNGPAEAAREEALELAEHENRIERLERQLREARGAMREALRSNSFQAYFAGVRLEDRLSTDLELAKLQGEENDGLEDMSSEHFLQAFEHAANEWPDPVLERAIQVYERRHGLRMLGVG